MYLRNEFLHGSVLFTASSVLHVTLRLVVIRVIFRSLTFRPTLFPFLQPFWGPWFGRVSDVKLTELDRAILEV